MGLGSQPSPSTSPSLMTLQVSSPLQARVSDFSKRRRVTRVIAVQWECTFRTCPVVGRAAFFLSWRCCIWPDRIRLRPSPGGVEAPGPRASCPRVSCPPVSPVPVSPVPVSPGPRISCPPCLLSPVSPGPRVSWFPFLLSPCLLSPCLLAPCLLAPRLCPCLLAPMSACL